MAKLDLQTFEHLARLFGTQVVGEVLLLAVARKCGDDVSIWNQAHLVGIPWQRKNRAALSPLQQQYNSTVETAALSVAESEESVRWADLAEASESLVGGVAASVVASLIPSTPTYVPPSTRN